ncbi:MAG: VPS10 domain-containing protein, partial [Gammaproteobacteria bacterium]
MTPRGAIPAAANPLLTVNWTEIGPGNVGGRINTIWVDPSNGQHLIVGAAGGGLWQSLDGGQSWTAIADFPGTLAVGALAQVSSTIFLAGTGDQFNEPQPGIGMIMSADSGKTWTPVAGTAPSASNPDWYYINFIAVASNGTILAATGDYFYPSDLLKTSEPGVGDGGIWRSVDGGQTWTKVWPTAGGENPSYDVVFDPSAPNDAVADTDTGTVVYSTDAGQTWNAATGLPAQTSTGYRLSLAFDSSTAGSVYALVDNAPSGGPSGKVFHSANGGATWTLLAGTGAFVNQHSGTATGALCDNSQGGTTLECQGDYDNVIVVYPQGTGNPPFILVGGINIFASTNGGTTWSMVGNPYGSGSGLTLHADQHIITASSTMFYVGNDGGMYEQKANSPYNWVSINSGLAITQFYRIAGYSGVTASKNAPGGVPITPILAGSQDNGMQLYEGYSASRAPQPNDWVQFFGGDGVAALVDPADGNFLYGEYPELRISYSTTGGPSGQDFTADPPDHIASPQTANFIAPITLIPNGTQATNQMLAGGASLWLGNTIQSGTPSWSALNGTTLPVGTSGNYINAIEIDPNTNNNIWLGYDDGELWHTTNATASGGPPWTKIVSTALPTNQQATSIWVVPGQSNAVYVTYAGFAASGNNIFATTDGGQTWQSIGVGLPPGPVYSLITDPNYPQVLYAGTYTGIYTSLDNGQT